MTRVTIQIMMLPHMSLPPHRLKAEQGQVALLLGALHRVVRLAHGTVVHGAVEALAGNVQGQVLRRDEKSMAPARSRQPVSIRGVGVLSQQSAADSNARETGSA